MVAARCSSFSLVAQGLIYAASLLCLFPLAVAAQGVDCSIAKDAIEIASRLRGLKVARSVPCRLQGKAEVERYLRDTIKKKIPEERIAREGKVYQLLGLIPRDYQYLEGIVGLYTEQLGGYYDAEKEFYAMAQWMPAVMQMPIAVHELTHALQDQHFALEELVDYKKQTSDALMAHSALVEGDATAVMLDYARSLSGQGSISELENVSTFMAQNITGAMISASLNKAPPSLQASLIFPYVSGLNFAHVLLKEGGYAMINKGFKNPPMSTEQILHPEVYLKGEKGFVEVPDHAPPKGVSLESKAPIFSDRFGEFLISTWLSTWISPLEASKAASGWGGDRVSLYQLTNSAQGVLVWDLRWDSVAEAREFFDALTEAFAKRFEAEPVQTKQRATFIDKYVGAVSITLSDQKVLLIIGA